jgi:hypothetical protein
LITLLLRDAIPESITDRVAIGRKPFVEIAASVWRGEWRRGPAGFDHVIMNGMRLRVGRSKLFCSVNVFRIHGVISKEAPHSDLRTLVSFVLFFSQCGLCALQSHVGFNKTARFLF